MTDCCSKLTNYIEGLNIPDWAQNILKEHLKSVPQLHKDELFDKCYFNNVLEYTWDKSEETIYLDNLILNDGGDMITTIDTFERPINTLYHFSKKKPEYVDKMLDFHDMFEVYIADMLEEIFGVKRSDYGDDSYIEDDYKNRFIMHRHLFTNLSTETLWNNIKEYLLKNPKDILYLAVLLDEHGEDGYWGLNKTIWLNC